MTPYPVPHLWPESTIACFGTGPSLTVADVEVCRSTAVRTIAVNDAVKLAPWADVVYAADNKWWEWANGLPWFTGLRYTVDPPCRHAVTALRNTGVLGLEWHPSGLRTGFTSGYQAINLAVHLGARRILLLGYDLCGRHYFGEYPDRSVPPFAACLDAFPHLVAPLEAAGIQVINCTLGSALTCFPQSTLAEALALEVAA